MGASPEPVLVPCRRPLLRTITDFKWDVAPFPTVNAATIAPYGQNPNYLGGLLAADIRTVSTDALSDALSISSGSSGAKK